MFHRRSVIVELSQRFNYRGMRHSMRVRHTLPMPVVAGAHVQISPIVLPSFNGCSLLSFNTRWHL